MTRHMPRSRPETIPVVLLGYGPVAQAYARLIGERRDELRHRLGIDLFVAGVRARTTEVTVDGAGEAIPERDRWSARGSLADLLTHVRPRIVVQAVPSDLSVAADALDDGISALTHGAHLVTATKTPLLIGWSALQRAASDSGLRIRISGATGAALPAGDLARIGLRGFDIDSIRGCVNGTSTFVLDRLADAEHLTRAIASAQQRGIAEADVTADLSGADAAAKMRLLTALMWDWDPAECVVELEPIDEATMARARTATRRGAVLRHVASADLDLPRRVTVTLREFDRSALPFGALTGPEKAIIFAGVDVGDITVSGGRSSPVGAARAMFKDTLTLAINATGGFE